MPRDAKIMSEALHRFQADKERRNARLERRTEEIYRRVPAVERIDRELRGTAARIVAAAFSEGGDPEKALEQLAALKGCQAHCSVILSPADATTYKKLGLQLTCEPKYQTNKLYHR